MASIQTMQTCRPSIPGLSAQILDQIHDSVVSTDLDGFVTSWNRGAERIFERDAHEMIGQHISVVYPADEHDFLREQVIRPVLERGEHVVEVRMLRGSGEVFYGHLRLNQLVDDGKPVGLIGYTMDITERVKAEERQRLLARELDHRVKNTLAAVVSLARVTSARATDMDTFTEVFMGRLDAMARAHEALAGNRWMGIELTRTLSLILGEDPRIAMDGEPLLLPSAACVPLCMALHELETNSRKYGALGHEQGRLSTSWRLDDAALCIEWTESNGPPVQSDPVPGLGLTLVRGLIEHEMGGEVHIDFRSVGLHARLSVPLPDSIL